MRFAVDTGGTFTDLIIEQDDGVLSMFKAPTTPDDPVGGVLKCLANAAAELGVSLRKLLSGGDLFTYGTTHALNAIVTGNTARTALLTSEGHRDILVMREGGRTNPFDFTSAYPEPYVPRALTWAIPGRILADGTELRQFDESAVLRVVGELKARKVEAVAVCLLWSIVNPSHERRVGALLKRYLPDVPFTLSHTLNPSLREYRRASSSCIDASLKPLVGDYIRKLAASLSAEGFAGRVLIMTSQGGVMDADSLVQEPIHLINSGPSMAPVAGRHFAALDDKSEMAIVADTGGTTYDISIVRKGQIPLTRELWIGDPFLGHFTGFPAVDVKSIGAGGGSIAGVDSGGLLHVGPKSAGAAPGPVCYGRGGQLPTVTDACVVLGYLDPDYFLGGSIKLDTAAARGAIERYVAQPLALSVEEAAIAIVSVTTENMVQAIVDITVNQGIDPRAATLVGGGGAAGFNSVLIGRRLGSPKVLIPDVGAALSAAGAMMSDLTSQFRSTFFARTEQFDYTGVNMVIDDLVSKCREFIAGPGLGSEAHSVKIFAEARYPDQVWEIEIPLIVSRFHGPDDLRQLLDSFHQVHLDLFAVNDPQSDIEVITWIATVSCQLRRKAWQSLKPTRTVRQRRTRNAYFPLAGTLCTDVYNFEDLTPGAQISGPALVESPFTTVVVHPGATAERLTSGSLAIDPGFAH